MRRLHPILPLAAACLLAGCVTIQHPLEGGASRVTKLTDAPETTPDVWPARWGDDKPGLGKGVIVEVEGPLSAWKPARHGPWHHRLPRDGDDRIVRALAAGRADGAGYRYRMEGFGSFVFVRDEDAPPPGPVGRSDPAFMFVFASGRVDRAKGDEPHVDIERTWFAYYDHRRGGSPAPGDAGNGVVMLLPGLFGVPENVVDIVVSTMRQRGWNVVRMLAPPARFVERSDLELDPSSEASARAVAAELMHRVAESAYASEAAMAYVLERMPELEGLPRAVVGGSAGAMALPATVMRTPTLYDAAVLIAGGSNILDIVARSTYTRPVQALDFRWAGHADGTMPDRITLDRFTTMYLDHAPLDGAHAAAALEGLPVLMLHAGGDRAVPADSGDRLWKTLGEPERWVIAGNHLTLFLSLWMHTPRIMDWLDAQTRGGEP